MAVDYYSYNHNEHKVEVQRGEEEDDDYIDMEVSSFTHNFPLSNNPTLSPPPPQNPREFEFHMSSSVNVERDATTSPADELFYMGKLLPLHLPPRLQMVERILQDSTPKNFNAEFFSTPLGTNTAATPTTSTPFESCHVSPVESCQVSRELNPEEYFGLFENNDDNNGSHNNHGKKSWTKKLKTKIKSLFGKNDEPYSSATAAVRKPEESSSLKVKEDQLEKQIKGSTETPCMHISQVISGTRFEKQNDPKENKFCHRRSFSGAFKRRYSTTKVSSSFSSVSCSSSSLSSISSSSSSSSTSSSVSSNSNGSNDFPLLKRSSSANSEIETSLIQGAIAHCKQSSQLARKTLSEVGCHSFPTSRFAALEDQITLCRG